MTTITVRIIRSFEYRNVTNMVLHDVDLKMTTEDLMKHVHTCKIFLNF